MRHSISICAPRCTPSAVRSTKNSLQRLQHLTVISRHRTLQDAAAELGVTWGTLHYQLKRIEETVGFTIIGTGRSRPLTITEDGPSLP
ncbi:LysR family transcriptional regulator [Streptomyces sp. NPDC058291]|uniref:helix-turn-helix domain-containing protein n=1 Tax=Streptomyces sp. NPDC058291 TaxID=3346427 RepID=UPI0036EE520D